MNFVWRGLRKVRGRLSLRKIAKALQKGEDIIVRGPQEPFSKRWLKQTLAIMNAHSKEPI